MSTAGKKWSKYGTAAKQRTPRPVLCPGEVPNNQLKRDLERGIAHFWSLRMPQATGNDFLFGKARDTAHVDFKDKPLRVRIAGAAREVLSYEVISHGFLTKCARKWFVKPASVAAQVRRLRANQAAA